MLNVQNRDVEPRTDNLRIGANQHRWINSKLGVTLSSLKAYQDSIASWPLHIDRP